MTAIALFMGCNKVIVEPDDSGKSYVEAIGDNYSNNKDINVVEGQVWLFYDTLGLYDKIDTAHVVKVMGDTVNVEVDGVVITLGSKTIKAMLTPIN